MTYIGDVHIANIISTCIIVIRTSRAMQAVSIFTIVICTGVAIIAVFRSVETLVNHSDVSCCDTLINGARVIVIAVNGSEYATALRFATVSRAEVIICAKPWIIAALTTIAHIICTCVVILAAGVIHAIRHLNTIASCGVAGYLIARVIYRRTF